MVSTLSAGSWSRAATDDASIGRRMALRTNGTAAASTRPYSRAKAHRGTPEIKSRYVTSTLTVHTASGHVASVVRNGVSHRRYHGYTAGAAKSTAANGHAQAAGASTPQTCRSRAATATPARAARAVTRREGRTISAMPNSRAVNRKESPYVPSEPIGNPGRETNGA